MWKRIVGGLDWLARADFVGALLSLFFDWRAWVLPALGAVGTFLWAAVRGRDPVDVWVLAVVVAAGLAIVTIAILLLVQAWLKRRSDGTPPHSAPTGLPPDLAADVGDLRVADSQFALRLFDQPESDRLLPLLEAEKLTAWGRPIGPGEPSLTRIPGAAWKDHTLFYVAARNQWFQNQTFLKTRVRQETRYYDVHLNKFQVQRIWQQTKTDIVRELDELYAQGVSFRNFFEGADHPNCEEERKKFGRWNERVIATLDTFSVADKSRFRTLNRFQWKYTQRAENELERRWLEAIWNEKLDRLASIIKESGA